MSGSFFKDFNHSVRDSQAGDAFRGVGERKMKNLLLTLVVTGLIVSATSAVQAQEIQQRKENQQDRIANGVKNGSLTPHETANLEHKEAALNKETRRDRRQNGGNLTNKEKAQINRQQNHLSRNIYRDKHNAAHQAQ
jgi:hypothetical protein